MQEGEAHWANAGAELLYWAQPEADWQSVQEPEALDASSGTLQKRKRKSNHSRRRAEIKQIQGDGDGNQDDRDGG